MAFHQYNKGTSMKTPKQHRAALAWLALASCIATFPAYAASSGYINFTGTSGNPSPTTCDESELRYNVGFVPTVNDDGLGEDWVAIVTVDADGTPIDVDFWSQPVSSGALDSLDWTDFGRINSPDSRPVTIAIFDTPWGGSGLSETSPEGFAFATSGRLMAQASYDPSALNSSCSGLPLLSAYRFPTPNQAVPTLSGLGLAAASLFLSVAAFLRLRRKG